MAIPPVGVAHEFLPNIYMAGSQLQYVSSFKYLGHFITVDLKDEMDIAREVRSLYSRGNTLIRKFGNLTLDVKCSLFKTYCYPLYASPLWCRFTAAKLYRLKVAYNNTMRRLVYVPPWESARTMFVTHGVKSFEENLRTLAYGLLSRIDASSYTILVTEQR